MSVSRPYTTVSLKSFDASSTVHANKTFVISKIYVLDVNGAAISSDKLSFDFTSARVQNFSTYASFKTQISRLLSTESEQVTWDLETSQATTLFTLKSNTEIGAIEFETDTDDETRDIQFKKKRWNGSTITTPTTSSGYMNRYKGLYEKKSASSSWYKRRFYDFQTPSSETELFRAKVLPVRWSLPVKFDSTITVDTSVAPKYINFNFVSSSHNVYLMTSKAAYDDGNFTGALQVTTNKRYQIPNGGNYYFSCKVGTC